jgi:hypothetical protein
MSAHEKKATNVVSLADYRRPQEMWGALLPVLKMQLVIRLANVCSVDLRLAAAIQRGEAKVTPGAG